ncbi:MAG: NAD(P)-binding protein [Acidiferrobacteraceae bacterium]
MESDILIIGSGAGGGTLARGLADSGLKVLVLERGDYLPQERQNWDPHAVFQDHHYLTKEHWRNGNGQLFHPETNYHVGGNTNIYGAAVLRRRESDFGERKHEGSKTVRWPMSYNDLASHYDQAGKWYFAHGAAGTDPTDPP